ncbi:MAG: hypothetical protein RL173_2514 [Fibrobacterota bacterium]|jgi:hypothetical protein
MANFLTNLFSAGASSLVDAVGSAIDKNTTSDAERKALDNELTKAKFQFEIESKTLDLKRDEAYLADVDSARVNQSRVQESANASWMSKNIQPFLAVVLIALTFYLFWYVIFSPNPSIDGPRKDIIVYILGALTTIVTQVVSYFFGSSKGSSDKNDMLKSAK